MENKRYVGSPVGPYFVDLWKRPFVRIPLEVDMFDCVHWRVIGLTDTRRRAYRQAAFWCHNGGTCLFHCHCESCAYSYTKFSHKKHAEAGFD
ncbi:hypothetical protein T12_15221 [Trichinella patagoniensis]|uniref:Uncharacterized protein n=1 Tax=Trichinella patagoniensis TaxID=990121 RepID=A0A0V0ZMK3_9BILA|nr:hypothetical protein T12_15221 [Trichinella patagoniensis]